MPFCDILGQATAIAALRAAIARDAVPQAYLFVGPEGVGKTSVALAFAQALVCRSPAGGDACGRCVHCRRIVSGEHPDLARIAPDGEFTRIWQLWSRPGHPPGALETLPFAPVAASKRIYLFERAETFNDESANSLLKALEEPPSYVQFILCAPSPASVLPTILSRCQLVRFPPVPTATIAEALTARKGQSESEARLLAAYAEGAPGRAFRLIETPELKTQRDALLDLAARIALSPRIGAFRLAEELRAAARAPGGKKAGGDDEGEKSTRTELVRALDVLAAWHGDLLAVALQGADAPVVHAERREQLRQAAARYPDGQLAQNLEHLFTLRRQIARNANAQLATEVLMLRLLPRER